MAKQPIKIKGLSVDLSNINNPMGRIRYDNVEDTYTLRLRVEGGVFGYYKWSQRKIRETVSRQTIEVGKNELVLEIGHFSDTDGYINLLDHITDLFFEGVLRSQRSWYDFEGFPVLIPHKSVRKHKLYRKDAKRGIVFVEKAKDFLISAEDIPSGEDTDAGISLVNHIILQSNRCDVNYHYHDVDDYYGERYYGNLSAERLVRLGNAVHTALEPVIERVGNVPDEEVEDIIEMIARILISTDDIRIVKKCNKNGAIIGYDTWY